MAGGFSKQNACGTSHDGAVVNAQYTLVHPSSGGDGRIAEKHQSASAPRRPSATSPPKLLLPTSPARDPDASTTIQEPAHATHHQLQQSSEYFTSPNPSAPVPPVVVPYLPPISRFTLRELDLPHITNDTQLLHDLYFDPNLRLGHTRRDASARKRESCYWELVRGDLEVPAKPDMWLVPVLVNEVWCILRGLVPPEMAAGVDSFFEDAQVAERVVMGRPVDFAGLVKGLCGLLRMHCAPVRDREVEVVEELARERRWGDCLRNVFELLEAMKLDLANHHLRVLYPNILTSLPFLEWYHFAHNLSSGRVDVDSTVSWLRTSWRSYAASAPPESVTAIGSRRFFRHAFLRLVAASGSQHFRTPETFRLDTSRLTSLRSDWARLADLACTVAVFRHMDMARTKVSDTTRVHAFADRASVVARGGASVDNLAVLVAQSLEHSDDSKSSKLDAAAISRAGGLLARALAPRGRKNRRSRVWRLLHRRLGECVLDAMMTASVGLDAGPVVALRQVGLEWAAEEVEVLVRRMDAVAELNRRTYAGLYAAVMGEIVGE